jgi:hypothetical protein
MGGVDVFTCRWMGAVCQRLLESGPGPLAVSVAH